ncbi:MAG: hypothetical protein ACRCZY_04760, partial [Phocaeicola sp.]
MILEEKIENKSKAEMLIVKCQKQDSKKVTLTLSDRVSILVNQERINPEFIAAKKKQYGIKEDIVVKTKK